MNFSRRWRTYISSSYKHSLIKRNRLLNREYICMKRVLFFFFRTQRHLVHANQLGRIRRRGYNYEIVSTNSRSEKNTRSLGKNGRLVAKWQKMIFLRACRSTRRRTEAMIPACRENCISLGDFYATISPPTVIPRCHSRLNDCYLFYAPAIFFFLSVFSVK